MGKKFRITSGGVEKESELKCALKKGSKADVIHFFSPPPLARLSACRQPPRRQYNNKKTCF